VSYLYVDDPSPIAAPGLGTVGVPVIFTSGAELIQSTGIDLFERPSIDYIIAVTSKDTATKINLRALWSDDTSVYGYCQYESAPAAGIIVLAPLVYQIDISTLAATFYLPVSFYRRGGARYFKLSIRSDAGSPLGYVTYQRRGTP
jgi:hypothetical protein